MLSALILRDRKNGKSKSSSLVNLDGKRLAQKIIRLQLGVMLVLAVIAFGFGWNYALGSLWGSLCSMIPFIIFAKLAFSMTGARMAQVTVRAFYLGESLKILSGLILLVVGLAIFRFKAEPLLISFALTMVPVWFGPLFLKTR